MTIAGKITRLAAERGDLAAPARQPAARGASRRCPRRAAARCRRALMRDSRAESRRRRARRNSRTERVAQRIRLGDRFERRRRRSPRITSLPSRLASSPRSHSSGRAPVAYAASGVRQSPARRRPKARSARVASVVARIGERCERGDHVARRSARHSIASAPCPIAGRLSSGSSSAAMRSRETESLQPRCGEDDRGVVAFVELAQPRVDVAAQRLRPRAADSARATAPRGAGSTCRRRSPAGSPPNDR